MLAQNVAFNLNKKYLCSVIKKVKIAVLGNIMKVVCHYLLLEYFSIFSPTCVSLFSHLGFSQVCPTYLLSPDKVNEVLLPRCPESLQLNHKSQSHLRKVTVAGIRVKIILSAFSNTARPLEIPPSVQYLLLTPFVRYVCLHSFWPNDNPKLNWSDYLACHHPLSSSCTCLMQQF